MDALEHNGCFKASMLLATGKLFKLERFASLILDYTYCPSSARKVVDPGEIFKHRWSNLWNITGLDQKYQVSERSTSISWWHCLEDMHIIHISVCVLLKVFLEVGKCTMKQEMFPRRKYVCKSELPGYQCAYNFRYTTVINHTHEMLNCYFGLEFILI